MGFDLSKNDSFQKDLHQYFTGAETSRNRQVLMHNRMGIRIEFDIDLCNLILWTTPKAGEYNSYRDRNFSCRDDNTALFDVIHFPQLTPEAFLSCDYDPFYSVIKYSDGINIEILSPVDEQAIYVRVNKQILIDIKSDKQDTPIKKEARVFSVEHPDRGYTFEFDAILSESGEFVHPAACDIGRSTYARAQLDANGYILFASRVIDDRAATEVGATEVATTEVAATRANACLDTYPSFDEILSQTQDKADEITSYGTISLNDSAGPDKSALENLLRINRSILVSAQDASGAIQAALKRIYYLIWNRDGGMIWALSSYAGLTWPLESWTDFCLSNPLEIDEGGWKGHTYAQMVNGKISKWQEDGTFYAVWAAFTHWTQTGDERFTAPRYINAMEDSIDWMERYCLDKSNGLFGRYFYCETPLTGSRDNGWDNAVGKPGTPSATNFGPDTIVRAYDIYVNSIMHSVYMMLAAMERKNDPQKADANLQKATTLAKNMDPFFDGESLPSYGYLKTDDGRMVEAPAYGMDECDYEWSLALAMFLRDPLEMRTYRTKLYADLMGERKSGFVAAYASVLSGMDTEFVDEQAIVDAVNYVAKQSYRPGDYLAMPNTIIEIIDVDDGNIFHDVRPQMFSISAMLAAVANLAVKKLPFGLAVRASRSIKGIKRYEYHGSSIDFCITLAEKEPRETNNCTAQERDPLSVAYIVVNGTRLNHTLQLPIDLLTSEACAAKDSPSPNMVEVIMKEQPALFTQPEQPAQPAQSAQPAQPQVNTLVYSTVRLESVEEGPETIKYNVTCYGQNQLLFRDLVGKISVSTSPDNYVVATQISCSDNYTLLSFEGVGEFVVTI